MPEILHEIPAVRPVAVMIHTDHWQAAMEWYRRALAPAATRVTQAVAQSWGALEIGGVQLEFVPADEKVSAGRAGTVVYWWTDAFEVSVAHLRSLGATLHRGPMEIENGEFMCQLSDPFGNLIGLRGKPRMA